MKLENIARNMFMDYAKRQTGMHLNWEYLSPERKLAWMREVVSTFESCLAYLGKELALPPSISTPAASYEKGWLAGSVSENKRLALTIDRLKTELADQIDKLETQYASN